MALTQPRTSISPLSQVSLSGPSGDFFWQGDTLSYRRRDNHQHPPMIHGQPDTHPCPFAAPTGSKKKRLLRQSSTITSVHVGSDYEMSLVGTPPLAQSSLSAWVLTMYLMPRFSHSPGFRAVARMPKVKELVYAKKYRRDDLLNSPLLLATRWIL